MIGIIFAIDFILLGVFFVKLFDEVNILKLLLYTNAIFICEYCIFSALLLALDIFSILYVLMLMLPIHMFICFLKRHEEWAPVTLTKECVFFFIAILFFLPWISVKGETLRTGSDVGFYYSKAVDLMFHDTHNVKIVKEFGNLSKNIDDSYLKLLSDQYYNYVNTDSILNYTYHSLYVWPSLLALFGSVFGLENIALCLTVLYIGSIGNMWYIIRRFEKQILSKYLVFILFGFSPIIIYLSKLTFSEMVYIYILTSGILFLVGKEKKEYLLSGVMFGTLEALHFSTILYLPIILLLLVCIALVKKERKYFKVARVSLFLFALFFICNFKSSPMYSHNQIVASFGKNLGWNTWYYVILIISLLGFVVLIYADKILEWKISDKLSEYLNRYTRRVLQIISCVLIMGIMYKAYVLGFTSIMAIGGGSWELRSQYANQGLESLWHTNIYSIILALSYIGLPYIYIKLFSRKDWNGILSALYSAFFYTLSIYTFIRSDTPSNYYGSRYFAIFLIPISVILICYLASVKREIAIITIVAVLTSLPYNAFLKQEIAYAGTKYILNDAKECIEKNTLVLLDVDKNAVQILATNLQEINGNKVYDIGAKQDIETLYPDEKIYLISNKKQADLEHQVMYKKYKISNDIACFDNITSIVRYPLRAKWSEEEIYIYILQ